MRYFQRTNRLILRRFQKKDYRIAIPAVIFYPFFVWLVWRFNNMVEDLTYKQENRL